MLMLLQTPTNSVIISFSSIQSTVLIANEAAESQQSSAMQNAGGGGNTGGGGGGGGGGTPSSPLSNSPSSATASQAGGCGLTLNGSATEGSMSGDTSPVASGEPLLQTPPAHQQQQQQQQPLLCSSPTSMQSSGTSVTGSSIASGTLAATSSSGVGLLPTTGLDSIANGGAPTGCAVVPASTSQVIAHLNAAAAAASGIMSPSANVATSLSSALVPAQSVAAVAAASLDAKSQPKRLHVSNIPFRFRDPDLRAMFGVSTDVVE